jgi:hypothetical protein
MTGRFGYAKKRAAGAVNTGGPDQSTLTGEAHMATRSTITRLALPLAAIAIAGCADAEARIEDNRCSSEFGYISDMSAAARSAAHTSDFIDRSVSDPYFQSEASYLVLDEMADIVACMPELKDQARVALADGKVTRSEWVDFVVAYDEASYARSSAYEREQKQRALGRLREAAQ